MTTIGVLVAGGIALVVGRLLLRRLGLPTDVAKAVAWGAVLLMCGLAYSTLRDGRSRKLPGAVGGVGAADILLLVLIAVLALIGRSWLKARLDRRDRDRAATRMRRRALPPAPNFPQDGEPPVA